MEAKQGKHKILAFRLLKDAATAAGTKLALQVSHTLNYARSNSSTQTKDGSVTNAGGLTVTLELNALASNDPVNNMLMDSVIEGEKLEIWEIDISEEATAGKYAAKYMRGNLQSWAVPAPSEGPVEISTTANIDGVPQDGEVTFTPAQIGEIQYAFRDLPIVV